MRYETHGKIYKSKNSYISEIFLIKSRTHNNIESTYVKKKNMVANLVILLPNMCACIFPCKTKFNKGNIPDEPAANILKQLAFELGHQFVHDLVKRCRVMAKFIKQPHTDVYVEDVRGVVMEILEESRYRR